MGVTKKSGYKSFRKNSLNSQQKTRRFQFLKSHFSSKKASRQFPLLSSIHSAVDGALIGVIISVALMSALALHWRYLWTVAFTRLETTRDLSHRLLDSTAMLERNLLKMNTLPITMVRTKADNLLYLDNPFSDNDLKKVDQTSFKDFLEFLSYSNINQGY
mgnify:CR=1 FL=1